MKKNFFLLCFLLPVVFLNAQQIAVPTIVTNDCLCLENSIELIADWDSTAYKEKYPGQKIHFNWHSQTSVNNWQLHQDIEENNKIIITEPGIYKVHIKGEDAESEELISNPFPISSPVLYWRQDARDCNWNNINNWSSTMDASGNVLTIPLSCTEVHLPGGMVIYPSLDVISTTRPFNNPIFDQPSADVIVFHQSAELGYPHLLKYNAAKVRYNLGNYTTGNSEDWFSTPLARDKWHLIAAPLKKMVSGDFSVSGYPFTWQSLFNISNPDKPEQLLQSDFSVSFAASNIELTNTNNALVLKTAPMAGGIGYNDHRYLEVLGGILEYPYHDNPAITRYRPNHHYFELPGLSRFYSFDYETLKILNDPIHEIKRGKESYRFIYETEDNQIPTIVVEGETVPGYEMTVKIPDFQKEVLIGNPFMASIGMKDFYEVNKSVLDESEGYQLFNGTNWIGYDYADNERVPSMVAFVVTFKDIENAALLFPLEGNYALTGPQSSTEGRSEYISGLQVKVSKNSAETNTVARVILHTVADRKYGQIGFRTKMISAEYPEYPELFFVDPHGKGFYELQVIDQNIRTISLGIKTSDIDNLLKLDFENVNHFIAENNLYPVLEDTWTKKYQDLQSNPVYYFTQRYIPADRQYADKDRFLIHLSETPTSIDKLNYSDLHIACVNRRLTIEAASSIERIYIYDTGGRKLADSGKLTNNSLTYQKNIFYDKGIYIVEVLLSNGNTLSQPIRIN